MMIKKCLNASLTITVLVCVSACANTKERATIISNVTTIDALVGASGPVDIVIVDDKIKAIGVEAGADFNAIATIEGTGKYVIPGLWDAHVHLAYNENIGYETFFPLSLAHGVTSMRDTGGHLELLAEARAAVKADPTLPSLYISGPLLDGEEPVYDGNGIPDLAVGLVTMEEASDKVDELAAAGVSFIKAYEMLMPDVFLAIVQRAKYHNLPVAAHIPLSMTGQMAVDAGANDMQHFRNLEFACASNEDELLIDRYQQLANEAGLKTSALRSTIHKSQRANAIGDQNKETCDAFIASLADNDVYQTPTLTVSRFMVRRFFADEEWKKTFAYMRPGVAKDWADRTTRIANLQADATSIAYDEWIMSMVARLADAGVPIMAGTDAPIGYLTPGASLHEELYMLVEGGLTPMQALRAATYEPARFLGLEKTVGSLKPNMQADLVVLSENPLDNIRNIAKIKTVVKSGQIVDRERLDAYLMEPSKILE